MMLVQSEHTEEVQADVLQAYLEHFPEKKGLAKAFVAQAEDQVRVILQ